ncbi:hypothetical protein ACJZ2D_006586 [Fusarium nematophilum]
MWRIEEQVPDRASLGKEALAWISCAKRQLTPLQLQHALAIEVRKSDLDDENIIPLGDIVSSCASLITVDEQSDTVRLVHFTPQEYLERTQTRWYLDAAIYIQIGLVTYSSFEAFLSVSEEDIEATMSMERHPFYTCAASHWGDHARGTPNLCREVEDFLWSEELITTGKLLRLEKYDVGELESEAKKALVLANGQGAIASLLLQRGSEARSRGSSSPLHPALRAGHEYLVELPFGRGGDDNLRDHDGEGLLNLDAASGSEAAVRLLLRNWEDVNLQVK